MSTECSKVECEREPVYLIEFSMIGQPGLVTMELCEPCWREVIDKIGIQLLNHRGAK